MPKSHWRAALATTLALIVAAPASAAIGVQKNGRPLSFDVPPVVENGRTLVPVRAIFESLGAEITWDPATETVTANNPDRNENVVLTLGSTTAWVDGRPETLEVAAKSIDGRTMVPLRFISTAMGAEVRWDPITATALIIESPLVPPSPAANGQALSRYNKAITATYKDATLPCWVVLENPVDDLPYVYRTNDLEYFEGALKTMQDGAACWDRYEQETLMNQEVPVGAEVAHGALWAWVDLGQEAFRNFNDSVKAHQAGDVATRDRLFEAGAQAVDTFFVQFDRVQEEMDALSELQPDLLSATEYDYLTTLTYQMSLVENCFDSLDWIGTGYAGKSDAFWADRAAGCWTRDLPAELRREPAPTARMAELPEAIIAAMSVQNQAFIDLADGVSAGTLSHAEIFAKIGALRTAWDAALPGLEELLNPGAN